MKGPTSFHFCVIQGKRKIWPVTIVNFSYLSRFILDEFSNASALVHHRQFLISWNSNRWRPYLVSSNVVTRNYPVADRETRILALLEKKKRLCFPLWCVLCTWGPRFVFAEYRDKENKRARDLERLFGRLSETARETVTAGDVIFIAQLWDTPCRGWQAVAPDAFL